MKINKLSSYNGNAVTRQYKKNKHFTYFGSTMTGVCLGSANLLQTIDTTGKSFILWILGVLFLHDSCVAFTNLLKLSKPYDEICQRLKKIYYNK